ncbi:MAG: hypothetical protein HY692_00685 [Cyanobacteria bacterium NC_groundwater_1444_Ag_S-0.65um_54_12]|nr:hypothetical protein [Cyanobacteria bacterium NC_groundwater_1444_Ag_S-0.65um_54_12]
MTIWEVFLVVLTIVLLITGVLLAFVFWQVSLFLSNLRGSLLPQLQSILTETQKSLVHVEAITQDVDYKLNRLDDTLADAQVTVHVVSETARLFSEGIARPTFIQLLSLVAGTRAAWQRYRELKLAKLKPLPK